MNKLMGFFELKDSPLPCIKWERYTPEVSFDDNYLWTIRVAIDSGNDLNLPRAVGVDSLEAKTKASEFYNKFNDRGIVIYYKYFIADKSGTIEISSNKDVIEAVDKDLWNLVTENKKNITIIRNSQEYKYDGDKNFLSSDEEKILFEQIPKTKRYFRDCIVDGSSVLLEWSFAYNTDKTGNPIGEKYLVFYEARKI